MKKRFLIFLVCCVFFPISMFSQQTLDKPTMDEFYAGFQYAIKKNEYFNAIIIASFSLKYPGKDYYGIQSEIRKVEYDFDNQSIVFKTIYDKYKKGYSENIWLDAFLKNNFLLKGSSLNTISDYIANQKYLK